ncbi:MAG: 30S ribosomal protein S4 [Candidatus Caldarchaeum sp.]|nr:30S ribosomal protein S4 [Candidatus Caldarchaeum sp.]MCS7129025.1 30S ribosomal protein S4 [Candidatus Caldarchaeum sp.]MDW8359571.1 30S ribosomal protein S4 [Candidatus Caldarchaeum sp.]
MGDPKRIRKKYETPGHPWRKERLDEELRLMGDYGLRNKREIWNALSKLRKYRAMARSLYTAVGERRTLEESKLMGKLYRLGLLPQSATLDDVLRLSVKDLLDRRLQTMVYRLGLSKTIHQARQFITHGKVFVGQRRVKAPSYHVLRGEEEAIRVSSPQSKPAGE